MSLVRRLSERRLVAPLALTAVAIFIAFWQRPHTRYSDQRIELITAPGRFFSQVSDLWTSTIDLGHIQASQFVGYLFPMGSFFAAGDAVGLPVWLVQRCWIAAILAIGAWGVVRLVERLFPAHSQAAPFVAGLIFISGPFITIGLNRGTSWLLAAALLPWMLIWTQRGIQEPRRWVAPAAVALLFAAAGGGLNAAVVVWLALALVLFGVFEALTSAGVSKALSFAWRAVVLSFAVSLWWIIPVLVQARYGANYLTFTEHAEAILHTSSASESLRLLGYWVGYINGYPDPDPQLPAIGSYLLSAPTIIATFAVPALALLSLIFLRRSRYASFFALLLGLAVLAMSFGFPQQGAIGRLVTDLYYSAGPLQFMRTTYKAAPLAALAIAVLAGLGLGRAFDYLRSLKLDVDGAARAVWPASAAFVVVVAALVLFWGRPLWAGNAVDPRLFFSSVPSPWVQAVNQAQSTTPADTRIAVLPGELFGWYTWGGTQNSVVPGLSDRPVLVRQITRPATEQAAQLLDSIDARIQQGRLTPGQLPPLLRLMGVGRVLVGSDSSPTLSEALDPARVNAELADQPGFAKPAAIFGPLRSFSPPGDRGGATVVLPQVRAYAAPRPAQPRITRVHTASSPTVVDGDAEGLVAMAGVRALDPGRASFYAADVTRATLTPLLKEGATITFTDSNRRRAILASKLTTNIGPTLGADDPLSREFPDYNPFQSEGQASRTVAVYSGLSALYSPVSPGFTLFPEHRPFAALDGNLNTSWVTEEKDPGRQYLQMNLVAPLAVGRIRVWPHRDFGGNTTRLLVSVNGGVERAFRLHKGWNSVPINNPALKSLRLRVPGTKTYYGETPEGIDEVSIPGLHVTEALRLPTRLASIASGQALTRSPIDVVLERVTADFPFRAGKSTGFAFGLDPVEMADAEPGLRRLVSLPTARRFAASGWAAVAATAPDSAIDTLVGMGTANRYDSSNRFEGVPINRASSAFDGNPRTAWITEYNGIENPSITWHGPAEIPVRRIILHRLPGNFLNPLRVTVATPLGGFDLPVRARGEVLLPVAVTTNQLTITIRAVRRPRTIPKGERAPKAIALSSIDVPGLPAATPERVGRFDSGCGAASVSAHGRSMPLAVAGDVRALDSGRALAFTSCASRSGLDLSKGSNLVSVNPGPIFTVDSIRLHGAAVSRPGPITVGMTGISPGGKVSLSGPGWLVLGQSYSPGWRAWCTDRSGAEHDLGSPRQIDGFANGWPIEGSSCASARFAFGPQLYANIGYWISGLAALMILALLALRAWRRRDRSSETEDQNDAHPSRVVQLRTASGLSLTVAQAGAPPAVAEGGWRRGQVSQVLFGFALAAVIVAGLLYVLKPSASAQGINFDYPLAHTTEHWIALAAMVALAAGAVVDFVGQTRCRRDGS